MVYSNMLLANARARASMEGRNTNYLSLIFKSQCIFLATFMIHATHVLPSLYAFSPSTVNATDEQALLSFKALITEDPQGALSSWTASNDTTNHFCNWQGVVCHSRQHPQRVTALELAFFDLEGTISPYLANMTFLHTLTLSHNRLSGNIPWELGHLSRLRYLALQNNSLQGEIPLSVTHSSRLQTLILEYNNLVGEIPANFSYCRELEGFDVSANQLSGLIPPSLGSLSKLIYFGIDMNNLVGGIPPSLGNLSTLEYFLVGMNNLGGHIPDSLRQMTRLKDIDLAFTGLTGTIPSIFFNMSSIILFELGGNNFSGVLPPDMGFTLPNLQYLYLYECQLTGQIPYSLGNASQLRRVELDKNEFEGTVPSNMGNLRFLEALSLHQNRLEAKWAKDWDLIASLANCSKLFRLNLNQNNFEGVFPPSFLNLSTEIKGIYMAYNKLYGPIPPKIGKLFKITAIELRGNFLSSTIPFGIGELHNLEALDLAENNIHGAIPPMLGNLTRLTILYLFQNKLQGSIPMSFGRLSNIASLILFGNQLSGTIPKELVCLPSLTNYLDLSNNFLTGQIPLEVGKLKNLILLDFSENKLSGEIPTTLGECVEMTKLSLEGNLLQGVIPQSFSGMKGIQYLDISHNNLSGPIPEFFDTLPNLEYLNLSYNNLEGDVPTKGVFSNASGFSVVGNKVCGGIPELKLSECSVQASDVKKQKPRRIVLISIVAGVVFPLVLLICGLFLCARRRKIKSIPTRPFLEDQHWQVSFAELQRATNQFSPANLIGTGSFGSVYKGTLGPNSQEVAIKVLNLLQHGAERSFLVECNALRIIRHRNLVKVITACSSVDHGGNDFKAFVYEFMLNGDLDNWLHRSFAVDNGTPERLTVAQRVNIALDIAAALEYLHHHGNKPIVHCDLKPSNVLLDNDMVAHVGDFGLSRFVHRTASKSTQDPSTSVGIKGSIGYIPPEYGMGGDVSVEGDVYSYGVLLLEMFTAKRPTDDLFQEGRSLQSYVAMAYPERIMEIVDPILLQLIEEGASKNVVGSSSSLNEEKTRECMAMIFRVGLRCTEKLPKARMHIGEVIKALIAVKNVLLGHGHRV